MQSPLPECKSSQFSIGCIIFQHQNMQVSFHTTLRAQYILSNATLHRVKAHCAGSVAVANAQPPVRTMEISLFVNIRYCFRRVSATRTGKPHFRQGKEKSRTAAQFTFCPGPPAMAKNNSTDIGETDACAFKIRSSMETLKHAEKFMGVAHIEADSIIADKDNLFGVSLYVPYFNASLLTCSGVFERIADKIDENLAEQRGVRAN